MGLAEARRTMRSLLAAVGLLVASFPVSANATTPCFGDGCAVLGYAIVTGGGAVASVGTQISLLEGEPDRQWGMASLGFAGANGLTAAVLLLLGVISDDEDDSRALLMTGSAQMGLAISCLVSGAHAVANAPESPPGAAPTVHPTAGLAFQF
jgi:hypothetical protein